MERNPDWKVFRNMRRNNHPLVCCFTCEGHRDCKTGDEEAQIRVRKHEVMGLPKLPALTLVNVRAAGYSDVLQDHRF